MLSFEGTLLLLLIALSAASLSPEKLPNIIFNIHDIHNFHYYKQLYHSHSFDKIEKHVKFNHKIIYTHTQCNKSCIQNEDCLFFPKTVMNVSYCFQSNYHNGERMLIQQIRSYLIFQNLGQTFWWKYMDLYSNNKCFRMIQITECVRKTLKQLNIQVEDMRSIQDKIFDLIEPSKLQQLQIQGVLLKVNSTGLQNTSNVYTSKLKQTIMEICETQRKSQIEQICKQAFLEPLNININSSDYYQYTFFEPNLHKNITLVRSVNVFFGQNLTLSDTFVILSVGKAQNYQLLLKNSTTNYTGDLFEWFYPHSFNATYSNYTSLKPHQSLLTTSQYQYYIKIPQTQLKNRKLQINLTFSGHKIYYLRIVQQGGNILRAGDIKRTILQANSTYDVVFDGIQEEQLQYFQLKIQLSTAIYTNSPKIILRGQKRNWNILYLCKNITQNNTIVFFINKTIFQDSASKQCEAQANGKITCNMKLQLSFNRTSNNAYARNQSMTLSFRKSLMYQITNYHQYKNNFTFNDKLIQKIQLANFGPTFKLLPVELQIRVFDYILDFEIRRCKNYLSCDFNNIMEWEERYQQLTTNQSFSNNNNVYYGSGVTIGFNNIKNQLGQHLKIQTIPLFLIYKRKAYDKSKISNIKDHMAINYYYGRIGTAFTSSYIMYSQSQSKRFFIRQPYNFVTRVYCVALVIDSKNRNSRIYARAFMKNYNEEYLFEKIQKKQIGLRQSNYQKLCFVYANSFDLVIDVYVEMDKKDNSSIVQSSYQIGYTIDETRKERPIRSFYLLSKSNKEIIIQSEPYSQNPMDFFTILLQSNEVVLINFQSVVEGNEIELCFFQEIGIGFNIKYCLAQTTKKYWGVTQKGFKGSKYENGLNAKRLYIKVFHNDQNISSFQIKLAVQKCLKTYTPREITKDYYDQLNKIDNNREDDEKMNNMEKYYELKRQKGNMNDSPSNQQKQQTNTNETSSKPQKQQTNTNETSSKAQKQQTNTNETSSKPQKQQTNTNETSSKPQKQQTNTNETSSKPQKQQTNTIETSSHVGIVEYNSTPFSNSSHAISSKDRQPSSPNQYVYFLGLLIVFLIALLLLLFGLFCLLRKMINLLQRKQIRHQSSVFVSQTSSNSSHLEKQGIAT